MDPADARALPVVQRYHPHGSDPARRVAQDGMVLRVQVGSGVHGTAIAGADDRDEMGIALEPAAFVTGIARLAATDPQGRTHRRVFEQFEAHTAWDRDGGLDERSGAGDLDVVVYAARKWARLALAGNPTVLLPLYVPEEEVVFVDAAGHELRANAERFASRAAADTFRGYLSAQRDRMVGSRSARTNRPELVAQHGYDTKFAMHALRLGIQGVELLTTGRLTLPIPQPAREHLRAVRRGEVAMEDVLAQVDDLAARLADLRTSSPLPEEPDRAWVDGWLHRSHLRYWGEAPARREPGAWRGRVRTDDDDDTLPDEIAGAFCGDGG